MIHKNILLFKIEKKTMILWKLKIPKKFVTLNIHGKKHKDSTDYRSLRKSNLIPSGFSKIQNSKSKKFKKMGEEKDENKAGQPVKATGQSIWEDESENFGRFSWSRS